MPPAPPLSALRSLPFTLCPLPSALCPLPSALCPLPSTLCPLPSALHPLPASSPLEEHNIGAVCRSMGELLRVPIIQRGAIMPDACPSSPAFASIPVGGAIAVGNAIIPGAHSEDVCCSLFATFYQTDLPLATQLDALMASTRFGPGGRNEGDWIPHPVLAEDIWENPYLQGLERHAAMHLGDQGDGNHFASIGSATFTPEQIKVDGITLTTLALPRTVRGEISPAVRPQNRGVRKTAR